MHETTNATRGEMTTRAVGGTLARLEELDNLEVADGDIDPRGWDVRTSDGRRAGKVETLIVDVAAMQVRYLGVTLDRHELGLERGREVLIPIGVARLDDDRDDVWLAATTPAQLIALPEYTGGAITRKDELRLRRHFDPGFQAAVSDRDFYSHEHYDAKHFFGTRRSGRELAEYLARCDDGPAGGQRRARAGDVRVQS